MAIPQGQMANTHGLNILHEGKFFRSGRQLHCHWTLIVLVLLFISLLFIYIYIYIKQKSELFLKNMIFLLFGWFFMCNPDPFLEVDPDTPKWSGSGSTTLFRSILFYKYNIHIPYIFIYLQIHFETHANMQCRKNFCFAWQGTIQIKRYFCMTKEYYIGIKCVISGFVTNKYYNKISENRNILLLFHDNKI